MSLSEWRQSFSAAIADVGDGMNYQQAASRLRSIIEKKLLAITDIVENPSKFFEAHRLLAAHATRLGPGFFIRFTVHFNLFAGTVMALGSKEQIAALVERNNKKPKLGCFGLTECLAGVNSGLVVETTAEYSNGEFIINTPTTGARKNWISQGLVADEAVVIANLSIGGIHYGPQAFLIGMRDDNGNLLSGITATDMGKKTVGNDLDNACLSFNNLRVHRDTLLCRYLKVNEDGSVSKPSGERRTMEMIGQRLFTGRVCVAQAALASTDSLFANTKKFASSKVCWAPNNRRPALIEVPQINALFQDATEQLGRLHRFMSAVESKLNDCLRTDRIPPLSLQQAIAVGKVKCIETSISLCFALKQEVGSFALMAGTGFEQMDFLQCCKFAEGDSRILMQKMARDLVRVAKGGKNIKFDAGEVEALKILQIQLDQGKQQGLNDTKAWDAAFREVYALAEAHMNAILKSYTAAKL